MLKTKHFYVFGEFRLDAHAKVLLRGDEPLRLGRKAVETLLALAEHAGEVLTKEELIETIWQGRVVDEANLQQNIAVIRKALDAHPGEPGYIQTFAGRGYRMMGPVVEEEAPAAPVENVVAVAPAATQELPVKASPGRFPGIAVAAAVLVVVLAGVGGIWTALHHTRAAQVVSPRRTPVARLDGKELQAAISPDGRDVAFILDRENSRPAQLWIRLGGQPQPLSLADANWDYSSPAWSPDGKLLAYLRFGRQSGELVVASRQGTSERVVSPVYKSRHGLFYHHLGWSPDGKWLAVDDTGDPEAPFAIFLISVATGQRRRVSNPPAHYVGDVEPRFSPDGKSLSYIRMIHRTAQVLVVTAADGSASRTLTKEGAQVTGYDWSVDGRSLVFASNQSGEFRLWRVNSEKIGAVPVVDSSDIYADAPIQVAVARAAPVLVYSVLRQDFNIWRLDLRAREGATGRWTEIINSSAQDASPQYSPDGREICFRSDRSGEEQIWVSRADGSDPHQVTQGDRNPSVGRWSPDGQSIVFNDSKRKDLYVAMREKGGSWVVRGLGVKGVHPVFSSDGQWIYTGRNDAEVESIFKVPAAGGAPQVISKVYGLSFGLSADGKDLYFVKSLPDTVLWRLSLASGQVARVLDGLLPYCTSCWAASEGGIYYLGTDPSSVVGQAIFFHSLQGGTDRRVVEYPEPLTPLGSGPFSLSPDGRSLLCVRVDSSRADVMRAEPFR